MIVSPTATRSSSGLGWHGRSFATACATRLRSSEPARTAGPVRAGSEADTTSSPPDACGRPATAPLPPQRPCQRREATSWRRPRLATAPAGARSRCGARGRACPADGAGHVESSERPGVTEQPRGRRPRSWITCAPERRAQFGLVECRSRPGGLNEGCHGLQRLLRLLLQAP